MQRCPASSTLWSSAFRLFPRRLSSGFSLLTVGIHLLLWISGCASSKVFTIDTARDAFVSGDISKASTMLGELADRGDGFAEPAQLDLAIVELAAGNPAAATARLRSLRDRFDETSEASKIGGFGSVAADAEETVGNVLSMVTDDNARVFKPAGYEEVMIRTMLAMCSLVDDPTDAESYMNQAALHQQKLRQVAQAKKKKFLPELLDTAPHQELALAPYLRGVLREATHHDFDDAKRNYQLVSAIKPDFAPAFEDLDRATHGNHSQADHGALYVFAMVGRGPVLKPTDAPVTTAAVSIASALMLRDNEKEGDVLRLPKITAVQVPAVFVPPSPIASVTVAVRTAISPSARSQPAANERPIGNHPIDNLQLLGATQTLTDVAQLVQTQADAELPWTIARAFVRQAGKELAVAKAREGMGLDGTAGTLFQFAAATAWTATESADTRCWGLLPREIQVLRAELPVGDHAIYLAPVGVDGFSIGDSKATTVRIDNGRNTYLVVIAPAEHLYLAQPAISH